MMLMISNFVFYKLDESKPNPIKLTEDREAIKNELDRSISDQEELGLNSNSDKTPTVNLNRDYKNLDINNSSDITSIYTEMIKESSHEVYTILTDEIKKYGRIKTFAFSNYEDYRSHLVLGYAALAFSIETEEQLDYAYTLFNNYLGRTKDPISQEELRWTKGQFLQDLGLTGNPKIFRWMTSIKKNSGNAYDDFILAACYNYDWVNTIHKNFPAIKDPREGYTSSHLLLDDKKLLDTIINWTESFNQPNTLISKEALVFIKEFNLL